jgi:hypothetical protein
VILIYSNPASRKVWEGLSDGDRASGLRQYAELTKSVADSGELIVSEALADPSLGRRLPATLPVPDDMVTDAPLAEAKEHLAGFYLVDCLDLDRVAAIAAQVPEAAYGLVEVRPVMTYAMPEL